MGSRRENTTHPSVSQSPTTRGQYAWYIDKVIDMDRMSSADVQSGRGIEHNTNNQQSPTINALF